MRALAGPAESEVGKGGRGRGGEHMFVCGEGAAFASIILWIAAAAAVAATTATHHTWLRLRDALHCCHLPSAIPHLKF